MKMKTHGAKFKNYASGILLLTLGIGTSVSSTLAWYSLSEIGRASFSTIEFGYQNGLRIGYADEVDIIYPEEVSELPRRRDGDYLIDVTSMGSDLIYEEGLAYPCLYKSFRLCPYPNTLDPTDDGFIQYELYLWSDEECHVYLGPSTGVRTLEEVPRGSKNPIDMIRISFYSESSYLITEPGQRQSSHTRFAGPLRVNGKSPYYENDGDKEIAFGRYSGEPIYGEAPESDFGDYDNLDCFHAIHKAGIKPLDVSKLEAEIEDTIPLDALIYDDDSEPTPLTLLQPKTDFRLVVTIYAEGWDLDMIDERIETPFEIKISFVAVYDII